MPTRRRRDIELRCRMNYTLIYSEASGEAKRGANRIILGPVTEMLQSSYFQPELRRTTTLPRGRDQCHPVMLGDAPKRHETVTSARRRHETEAVALC